MAMMSSTKLDVVWSPVHHKNFVIWGSDITLYEVSRLQEIDKNTAYQQISPTRGAKVVASQSASHIRCVDMCAIEEHPEPLLAVGYNSGKVALTTLKQTQELRDLVGREFVPRYSRLCNSVAWNHMEKHLLLSGLEKHKSDHSILLWDVTRIPDEQPDPSSSLPPESERPVSEMGLAETVHSVSWVRTAPRSLLASMSLKYIKIFDIRELSNKCVSTATTRYCYNACADPLSAHQLASRGDNVVCVWDDRALLRPLLTLPQTRPVARIQWCPTRRNLLLSLQRDATTIKLHEIQATGERPLPEVDTGSSAPRNTGEIEAESPSRGSQPPSLPAASPLPSLTVMERELNPNLVSEPAPLAAFACHPVHEARLLALCQSGVMCDYTVRSRVCVSWGAAGGAAWSAGGRGGVGGLLHLLPAALYRALGDVEHRILQRARLDYGLKTDLWQNADIAKDEALSSLWHFLALSKSLVEDGCIRNSPWKHPGVRTVLGAPGEGYRSETAPTVLPDMPSRRVAVYRSAERTRCLQVCGWGWGWDSAGAGVERAEAEGTPCRAAAIAAFHLRLRTALEILARAHQPQLQVAALALAGLTEDRLWRELSAGCCGALPDPYLRALLHFLRALVAPPAHPAPAAPPATDFSQVLAETGMRLEDRVSFACIFLPDAKLHEYVKQTSDELVQKGDLSGLLLTGTSPEGVELLQRYLENTGDVQTVALVAARCFTAEQVREPSVQHWLDSYRNLLNSLRLYWARCALDTLVCSTEASGGGAAAGGGTGARVVGVACAYCGKAIGAPHPHHRARPRLPPPAAKMKQLSACPNCRKPLPRCGVCGQQVGGAGGPPLPPAPFPSWFTFCPACRHGGHAHHMLGWFEEHYECPVSSCTCRCNSLDPPDPQHRFK